MHQRAALQAGEDRRIDLLGEVRVIGQDHAAAGAAQGLVRGRGDDMGVRERRGMGAARDEPGEMGDVDDEISADRVANGAETLEVPMARIGRAAGDDQLRLVLARQRLDLIHVDPMRRPIDAIGDRLEPAAGHVDRRAMGQVPACREIKAHESVAGLHQRHEHALIGLAAGIGLDIGEAGSRTIGTRARSPGFRRCRRTGSRRNSAGSDSPPRICWSSPSPAPRARRATRCFPRR